MNRPDCLIVGAGVTGLVSALELSRRGLRVALVDSQTPAAVLQNADGEAFRLGARYGDPLDALRRESLRVCSRLLEPPPGAGAWPSVPELHVVTRGEDLPRASSWCEELRRQGSAAEFLSQNDLGAFDAALRKDVFGGVLLPAVPLLESRGLHQSLLEACAGKNIVLRWETVALGLCVEDGRAVAVRTRRGVLAAGAILLTAGIGAMGLISAAGLQLPIVPEQRHTLVASPASPGSARLITSYPHEAPGEILGVRGGPEDEMWVLLRPERESLVTGGRSFAWSRGTSHRTAVDGLREDFAALLPGQAHLLTERVTERVHACIADGLPVIGPASMIDTLYFGLHRSDGRGTLAPAVGALAAQALAAPAGPGRADPFSMDRFPQSAPGGQKRVKD